MALPRTCPVAGYGWLWMRRDQYVAARELISRHVVAGESGCPDAAVEEFRLHMLPALLADPYYRKQCADRAAELTERYARIDGNIDAIAGGLRSQQQQTSAELESLQEVMP